MQYYNRKTARIEEEPESMQASLHFLYETALGRLCLKCVVARPWLSKVYGRYQKSRLSRRSIRPFIEKNKISVDEWNVDSFRTFNDFFTRKKESAPTPAGPQDLLSIADSKIRIFPITEDLTLKIKHSLYTVEEILGDKQMAEEFRGGTCIVFRLAVDDYHRYHHIDGGRLIKTRKIKGVLHTVRSISDKCRVFARNSRQVSLIETEHLGKIAQIEVGALFVGKIVNHEQETFEKMQEKGYFEFGGSTVVVLINKNVEFDADILEMNAKDLETKVRLGERIGRIPS